MKIFLTGGTGFIGSHFINHCHEAGHDVLALRRSNSSFPRVKLHRNPDWLDKEMADVVAEDFKDCRALVHFAAHSANVPYDTLDRCLQFNVLEPLALFEKAVQAGINKFIVAGTCFEYGSSGEKYAFIPSTAPLEPTASYPASKAAASSVFHALAVEKKLELLLLRIFQVYGEGESQNRFWPTLRRKALAGEDMEMSQGLQIRDFINVTDVATHFVKALERNDIRPGQPIVENLGSGNPKSLAQFAEEQWASFSARGNLILGAVPMRPEEIMRYVPEIHKINQ